MKLIILNGPSCSGKSTIIKEIMQDKENLFHLSHDLTKWCFSKYERNKHYEKVQAIVLAIADKVFDLKEDVISDASLTKEFRHKLIKLAKKKNYKIFEINLEADFKILLKRFNKRVESALKVPIKDRRISNTSIDRFKELFEIYNKDKNPKAITFKSYSKNKKQIINQIKEILK